MINHKRVYRLYREDNLMVRRRKRIGPVLRVPLIIPNKANLCWSMDFVHNGLAHGRHLRALTIVDNFTRECLHIEVDTSLNGLRVARVLTQLAETRGLPSALWWTMARNS